MRNLLAHTALVAALVAALAPASAHAASSCEVIHDTAPHAVELVRHAALDRAPEAVVHLIRKATLARPAAEPVVELVRRATLDHAAQAPLLTAQR